MTVPTADFKERLLDEILMHYEEATRTPTPAARLRRQLRRRSVVVGVATLLAAGVAGVAIGTSGSNTPSTVVLSAQTVAYRTHVAVSSATNQIEYLAIANTGPGGVVNTSAKEWVFGNDLHVEHFIGSDTLTLEAFYTPTGTTYVDYGRQGYWQSPPRACASAGAGCAVGLAVNPGGSSGNPVLDQLNSEIAGGSFTSTSTTVDGRPALDIEQSTGSSSEQIWVDPTTFLPFAASSTIHGVTRTTSISWLDPSATNMATFTAAIPAGFTQIPVPTQTNPPAHGSGTAGNTGAPTGGSGTAS